MSIAATTPDTEDTMPNATSRQILRDAATASYREGAARLQEAAVSGTLPITETRPVPSSRAPRGRSATAQAEALAGLIAEKVTRIQDTAAAEVRHYLGEMLLEMANRESDAQVLAVQYAGEEVSAVSDDFRAGLRLAARLVADPEVEY